MAKVPGAKRHPKEDNMLDAGQGICSNGESERPSSQQQQQGQIPEPQKQQGGAAKRPLSPDDPNYCKPGTGIPNKFSGF